MSKKGLTSEQMIFQAASGHEFVYQKPVFVLIAIPNQFHKMRMIKLPEIIHFCLEDQMHNKVNEN